MIAELSELTALGILFVVIGIVLLVVVFAPVRSQREIEERAEAKRKRKQKPWPDHDWRWPWNSA